MSTLIDECVKAWLWCSDPKNLEAGSIRINGLHKACFNSRERSEVDRILTLLEGAGVVGPEFEGPSAGGRRPDMRTVGEQWQCFDNDEASAIQEVRLREKLMRAIASAQAVTPPATPAAPPPARPRPASPAVTPLRMLAEATISLPDGGGTVHLQAGSIVTYQTICKLLRDCPEGTQPIADADDQDTC